MRKSRHGFLYNVSFAWINLIEAILIVLTLGYYSPSWTLRYAAWYSLRSFQRRNVHD